MKHLLVALVALWTIGCGGGDAFSTAEDDGASGGEAPLGLGTGGSGASPAMGGSDGGVPGAGGDPSPTGGSGGAEPSTGGTAPSTGGVGSGGAPSTGGAPTGGTGGSDPDDGCFSQWDPGAEYEYPAAVQVGVQIFELCVETSVVGAEPVNQFGYQPISCEGGWRWIGDCPSQKCGDALAWDESAGMDFTPPALSGTLLAYGGQVWELEGDTIHIPSSLCPPNPDPGHWCEAHLVEQGLSFSLATQCL
jgi:hypothetical protein